MGGGSYKGLYQPGDSKPAAEEQDGSPVSSGEAVPYWFRVAAEINLTPDACERVFAALERAQ